MAKPRMEMWDWQCFNPECGHKFKKRVPTSYIRTKNEKLLAKSHRTGKETCSKCGLQRLEIVSKSPN